MIQEGHGRGARYHLMCAVDSLHKDPNSLHKDPNSLHNGMLLAGIPEIDLSVLRTIARPASEKRRVEQGVMEGIILSLCEGRYLTRRQLAELLDRNPEGLRSRFLVSMVEHGLLRLKFPKTPNRTDQAYITAVED